MSKNVNTNTKNAPTTIKTGRWSPAENEALMKAIKNKPAKSTMTQAFDQFGLAHNRAASSVAQHYYQLTKESSVVGNPEPKMVKSGKNNSGQSQKQAQKQNKSNPNDISSMVNKIKKMPTQAIRSLSYIVNSMQVQ